MYPSSECAHAGFDGVGRRDVGIDWKAAGVDRKAGEEAQGGPGRAQAHVWFASYGSISISISM
eukprot:scaffold7626_cov24-Tisochrysis_lutea.AAC.1